MLVLLLARANAEGVRYRRSMEGERAPMLDWRNIKVKLISFHILYRLVVCSRYTRAFG
jgi:hypothetical protein